jgi:hypothetical protein
MWLYKLCLSFYGYLVNANLLIQLISFVIPESIQSTLEPSIVFSSSRTFFSFWPNLPGHLDLPQLPFTSPLLYIQSRLMLVPKLVQYVHGLLPLFLANRRLFPQSSPANILPIPQILAQMAFFPPQETLTICYN